MATATKPNEAQSAQTGTESHARLWGMGPILDAGVRHGDLTIIDSAGRISRFGQTGSKPCVVVRFKDAHLPLRILLNPSLAVGEAYMRGTLRIEFGSLDALFEIMAAASDILHGNRLYRGIGRFRRLLPQRPIGLRAARSNAAHHYDLPGELYDLFLDQDRQYSCAYFETSEQTLEEAQAAKKRHLMKKLRLASDQSILDIGSGWGGLALDLARAAKARVTGITLSQEQLAHARLRAEQASLNDRVRFEFKDYREVDEAFDRIVSVGMFEHVGPANYQNFFATVERLLKPDGVAVIHSIGHMEMPVEPDPWIDKYIFPGGYIPSLSQVLTAVERTRLWITDIEVLRLHYATTLRHWAERFQRRRAEAVTRLGEHFCRMWEFYLASAQAAFRHGRLMVFQLQLAHRRDAVPLTRGYIYNGAEVL